MEILFEIIYFHHKLSPIHFYRIGTAILLHRKELGDVKRIVVKVGSKILTPQNENEHLERIASLVSNISQLVDNGIEVIFVSSGAVSHGRIILGLKERPKTIPLKQACAGVGQIELLNIYRRKFDHFGKNCGQILLTWDDLREKKRYLNLRNTLYTMLENGVIPIINENDSVGVDEIKFGDNDTLAAQIAMVANADLFITLTDINGLYTANPKKDPDAKHIPLVTEFTDELRQMADADGTDVGTGGMFTKLNAAEMVCKAGIAGMVADGYDNELIDCINNPILGTLFTPLRDKMPSRDRFIAFTDQPNGIVIVDSGAKDAMINGGKSLLPAGIVAIDGDFSEGDTVKIINNGETFAKGIANYDAKAIAQIKGKNSYESKKILGTNRFGCVIHRNNMVFI